jgi:hypothetical protein
VTWRPHVALAQELRMNAAQARLATRAVGGRVWSASMCSSSASASVRPPRHAKFVASGYLRDTHMQCV